MNVTVELTHIGLFERIGPLWMLASVVYIERSFLILFKQSYGTFFTKEYFGPFWQIAYF
jgi:hypothetical protein